MTAPTATVVLVYHDKLEEHVVDASPMSAYPHELLGGTPTFVGAWENVSMLARADPLPHAPVLRCDQIPPGAETNIPSPALLTRLNEAYVPIDFTVNDYHALLGRT